MMPSSACEHSSNASSWARNTMWITPWYHHRDTFINFPAHWHNEPCCIQAHHDAMIMVPSPSSLPLRIALQGTSGLHRRDGGVPLLQGGVRVFRDQCVPLLAYHIAWHALMCCSRMLLSVHDSLLSCWWAHDYCSNQLSAPTLMITFLRSHPRKNVRHALWPLITSTLWSHLVCANINITWSAAAAIMLMCTWSLQQSACRSYNLTRTPTSTSSPECQTCRTNTQHAHFMTCSRICKQWYVNMTCCWYHADVHMMSQALSL